MSSPPRPSRGREWVNAHAGQLAAGEPLAEWGHVNPRFPTGITNSALRRAPENVQRETALIWFTQNLVPYDLTKGGPYFGFAQQVTSGPRAIKIGGYGVGYYAPSPITSVEPLLEEFSDSLPESVIRAVANYLPGDWMWIAYAPEQVPEKVELGALLAGLATLKQQIKDLAPAHGGMGHNSAEDFPRADELKAAVAGIEELEVLVPIATEADTSEIGRIWSTVLKTAKRLGLAASAILASAVLTGVGLQIGKELWPHCHHALQVWETAHDVGGLLAQFTNLL